MFTLIGIITVAFACVIFAPVALLFLAMFFIFSFAMLGVLVKALKMFANDKDKFYVLGYIGGSIGLKYPEEDKLIKVTGIKTAKDKKSFEAGYDEGQKEFSGNKPK